MYLMWSVYQCVPKELIVLLMANCVDITFVQPAVLVQTMFVWQEHGKSKASMTIDEEHIVSVTTYFKIQGWLNFVSGGV